jgi:hypothetical protein
MTGFLERQAYWPAFFGAQIALFPSKTKECTKMPQQNQRSSSDDWSSKPDHEKTRAEGKSGGNAGAGQSGKEGLGTEKKTDDERFGSRKPTEA